MRRQRPSANCEKNVNKNIKKRFSRGKYLETGEKERQTLAVQSVFSTTGQIYYMTRPQFCITTSNENSQYITLSCRVLLLDQMQ